MNTNKRKDYFDEYAEKEIESGKLWRGLVANEFYKNFVEQLLIYGNVFVKDGKIVDPKKLILNMKQKNR